MIEVWVIWELEEEDDAVASRSRSVGINAALAQSKLLMLHRQIVKLSLSVAAPSTSMQQENILVESARVDSLTCKS